MLSHQSRTPFVNGIGSGSATIKPCLPEDSVYDQVDMDWHDLEATAAAAESKAAVGRPTAQRERTRLDTGEFDPAGVAALAQGFACRGAGVMHLPGSVIIVPDSGRSFVAAAAAARLAAVANEVVASKLAAAEEERRKSTPDTGSDERSKHAAVHSQTAPDEEVANDEPAAQIGDAEPEPGRGGAGRGMESETRAAPAMPDERREAPPESEPTPVPEPAPAIVPAERVAVVFAAEPERCALCDHIASGSTMPRSRGGHTYGPGCSRARNRKRK